MVDKMPTPRLLDQAPNFSLSRQPFYYDRSHGVYLSKPANQRDEDSPINSRDQLRLRASAALFLAPKSIQKREEMSKTHNGCCRPDVVEVKTGIKTGDGAGTRLNRYLNCSPSCYGGIHKVFALY